VIDRAVFSSQTGGFARIRSAACFMTGFSSGSWLMKKRHNNATAVSASPFSTGNLVVCSPGLRQPRSPSFV
jgi:hypothetical protein